MDRPVILIVEDESLPRIDAVEFAEASGYAVVEAANADEAIRILESRNDIRIVFTDIHMPGSMYGLKLAQAVRERWPPIKLVVTSGQTRPSPGDLPAGAPFVPKPYRPQDVTRTFRALIGAAGS
jgi:CheY-like chemotaxis protein